MVGSCPNCGAWVAGDECEYCGTRFAEKVEEKYPIPYIVSEPIELEATSLDDTFQTFRTSDPNSCNVIYNGMIFHGIKEFNSYCEENDVKVKKLKRFGNMFGGNSFTYAKS